MSYATVRAAIKTALEAVTGITGGAGRVQDHHPQLTRKEDYIAKLGNTAANLINGWTISRQSFAERNQDAGFRYQIVHDILVRAYHSMNTDGTTETTFQDLLDTAALAIRGSVAIWVDHPEDEENAMQGEIIAPVTFGSWMLHHAQIKFRVEEFVVIAT